jgi:hypothetical protein
MGGGERSERPNHSAQPFRPRYKLPKLAYHAFVNPTTGKVVPGDILKDCLEKSPPLAVTAKQMIREQGKGQKGIQEVSARERRKPLVLVAPRTN